MKKILLVGSSLEDKGGIVTVMSNILNSSLKNKFKIDMLETYITGSKGQKVSIYIKSIFSLFTKLFTDKPDLAHIHMSYKGSFYRKSLLLLILKFFNVPVLLHVHGSSFKDFYGSLHPILRKYCNYILNKSDKLIVLSTEWYDYFSDFVKKDKIVILYNGVEEVGYELERNNNNKPICLFMGRLGQRKGVYDLIQSIKILADKNIECEFLLAGDGEIEEVRKEITALNIQDQVKLLGWINNEQKTELLEKSDILVLPSYNEGLPMAILEAMSYGLPIVSTPVGGIPEAIKPNENGFLVNPGNIQGLADCLETLIKDPTLRRKMGRNNQQLIHDKFSLHSLMVILEDLYNNTISKENPKRGYQS
jgi:glycosyltransferase involved in cell wall biosynthesis